MEQMRPELSFRIADFLKDKRPMIDILPKILPSEMHMLETWRKHYKDGNTPFVVTYNETSKRYKLWKRR